MRQRGLNTGGQVRGLQGDAPILSGLAAEGQAGQVTPVLNSEDETGQNSGWAIVEVPARATVGMTIPLLKEAK
jgi:hypothetical protein